jgi:hypothetical protein
MNYLYRYGKTQCRECFKSDNQAKEQTTCDGWKLNNNPSYWGSSNPKTLVLGYSKGITQMNENDFDE